RAWVTNLTSGEAAAEDEGYVEIRWWRAPNNWTPAISSWFYGGEVRSAHFISNGEGKKKATWTVEIKEGAYYDVYTYIDGRSNPSLRRNDNDIPDKYHYTVYHDDGSEEVVIELKNAANGWNNLGSFYLSPGEAQVEITDRADGRIVIADAIKWVKR
ncbi:MAG: hypothetical protein OEX02_10105, partial [Cyclobacteriaceae bacterium]|nr:hypothetical protein [Cyclobacteriaceae bacterium]